MLMTTYKILLMKNKSVIFKQWSVISSIPNQICQKQILSFKVKNFLYLFKIFYVINPSFLYFIVHCYNMF